MRRKATPTHSDKWKTYEWRKAEIMRTAKDSDDYQKKLTALAKELKL